jgi:hypothetical protein
LLLLSSSPVPDGWELVARGNVSNVTLIEMANGRATRTAAPEARR